MVILNIHGYKGSPKNSACNALKSIGCNNIISPSIDYDSEKPDNIIGRLNMLRVEHKVGLVVGTSLGGFFASVLSAQHNMPVLLVNPCLTPFLIDFLPRYEVRSFIRLFGNLSKIEYSNVSCIVGDADEVLGDHVFTEKLLHNPRFRRIPDGKHSGSTLPLTEYFSEMLHYYTEILPLKDEAECIPPEMFD